MQYLQIMLRINTQSFWEMAILDYSIQIVLDKVTMQKI